MLGTFVSIGKEIPLVNEVPRPVERTGSCSSGEQTVFEQTSEGWEGQGEVRIERRSRQVHTVAERVRNSRYVNDHSQAST